MSKIIDNYCDDCIFLNKYYSAAVICDYIGHTGHRRGCPPGTGCTKKEVSRRRAKKQNQTPPDAT